jgi:GAF domain-containing protein
MSDEDHDRSRLSQFTSDVVRAALVDLVGKALSAAAVAIAGVAVLLVIKGGSVPAWVAIGELAIIVLLAVLVRRRGGRLAALRPVETEIKELKQNAEVLAYAVSRHEVYAGHLAHVLDHLQRVISGDIDVSIPEYIRRGILEPARDVLMEDPSEDVRLSILLPDDARSFFMAWAAGHDLESQTKYRVPIDKTLARIAFESGEAQAWDDATTDDRFEANPYATRPLRAMVSVPLRSGDRVVGVFNAIASEPNVFDSAEHSYLTALGGILNVTVSVWLDREEATGG